MSTANNIQISQNVNNDFVLTLNKKLSIKKNTQNDEEKIQNKENIMNRFCKPIYIILFIVGIIIIVGAAISIPIIIKKFKKDNNNNGDNEKNEETEEIYYPIILSDINKNNYIKTTAYEDFVIPSDRKLQVVGADFQHKNSTFIIGTNKHTFFIDDNGIIKGVTKDDFPLYYSFNETITNGSYLFKDVKCFKTIDLSKMDSSKMIDASNMFENSNFEEIYFGTENESYIDNLDDNSESRINTRNLDQNLENITQEITDDTENEKRKEYFDTSKIKSVYEIFLNCIHLKKIKLPPSFNVGKNAKGMFKGCTKLVEVNTTLISSTEIEEMESMFEDCQSLKEISFSNDFLTGEIKSLFNVFKNTNLNTLDISYLRLFSLENSSNIFDGASIKGTLKIGKYYSNNSTRDNLFKEIAKVTDSNTDVFTPNGTIINQVFQNIYYSEKNVHISVNVINIDYNIHYKEDENYKLYSSYLHVGLGWDYNKNNRYDLDSSILTFDYNFNYLNKVNFEKLTAYNGAINLNGDDLTGEGDGDDEEIKILLDLLPSEVQIFTVQLNSFTQNILKNVESAYIRLSTDTEIIGTYSITQGGDNIGLLIGCFSKNISKGWYFRPLNRVIPGHIVTESVSSIQEILHLILENRLISAIELVQRLMIVANERSVYSQKEKYNSLYWNGTHWFADCSNLIKSIINGRDVYNPEINSYQKTFPIVEDVNANTLILKCNDISNDFNNLEYGVPRLLHLKDKNGNGHVGVYLGRTLTLSKGNVNVIESTTSWKANAVIYSWVDYDGTRRFYKGGELSENKYNWTSHASLNKWVWY